MVKQVSIGAIALGVLALGMFFILTRKPSATGQETGATTTGTVSSSGGVDVTGSDSVTIMSVEQPQVPDYRKPLSFSSSVPADARDALTKQLNVTIALLEKEKLSFQGWINLGVVRKMAGDYRGAEEAWFYAATVFPSSTVPSDNLGDLYMDFLKDYAKAEANFKTSLKVDPSDINAYQHLFDLYTVYGYKDKAAAQALVEQGLKANPDNETLLQMRAQLQ